MIRPALRNHSAVLIIDGQAVRVLIGGTEPISDDTRAALEQLVRDCRDRLNGEPPPIEESPRLTSGPDQELNWPPPGWKPAEARAKGSHPL